MSETTSPTPGQMAEAIEAAGFSPAISYATKVKAYFVCDWAEAICVLGLTVGTLFEFVPEKLGVALIAAVMAFLKKLKQTYKLSAE